MFSRQPIELLKVLSPRTINALHRFDIHYVDQINFADLSWTTQCRGIGKYGRTELELAAKVIIWELVSYDHWIIKRLHFESSWPH